MTMDRTGGVQHRRLNDVWGMKLSPEGTWQRFIPTCGSPESAPPARVYHSLTAVGTGQSVHETRLLLTRAVCYVFGGRSSPTKPMADMWRLKIEQDVTTWNCIQAAGCCPAARWRHTCTNIGDSLYVFGGKAKEGLADGDLYKFTPTTGTHG